MTPLRFAELFAGVGGLSLGLHRAGMTCAFHAELAPFPRRVLRARFPDVPLYGDVRALSGGRKTAAWMRANYSGKVDLIAGGSLCQDLSVAGKRAGLGGLRSSLFFRQARLWRVLDCPYFLWENVAGALSSNDGADFALILSTLVGATVAVPADGWGGADGGGGVAAGPRAVAAWRLLDAQHFGVPQRRLRVFVLAARAGGCDPAEVLLEPNSVRGNPPARRSEGEGTTGDARSRSPLASGSLVADTVTANYGKQIDSRDSALGSPNLILECVAFHHTQDPIHSSVRAPRLGARTDGMGVLAFNTKQDGADADVIAPALLAMSHDKSHGNGGGQLGVVAFQESQSGISEGDTFATLDANYGGRRHNGVVAFDPTQITHPENRSNPQPGDPCHPLVAAGHPPVIAFDQHNHVASDITPTLRTNGQNSGAPVVCATGEITHALTHEGHDASEDGTGRGTPIVARMVAFGECVEDGTVGAIKARDYKDATDLVVGALDARTSGGGFPGSDGAMSGHVQASAGIPRRLMPVECERLMSWDDGWTDIPDEKGKPASDSARYKACGNGVVSNVAEWIGARLQIVHNAMLAGDAA